ncbi:MAG: hypothetical protein IPJ87_10690 [Flavobacteriales bacterium]|nr:hypothetical protein [Flavobacteriales bacterium]MBK7942321.1 hypothetical protein [Flavobacteriales bacterium]MBK9699277.1 hypothetical protein [Flavobacteriales bacterium]
MNTMPARIVPLAALLLLGPALFNGYPLVYADTGTYLTSGFQLGIPADRPLGYGLFCRLFSGDGLSLWGVVIAQALLTAVVLVHAWQVLVGRRWGLFLATTALLSATTGLGWYTGRLLPDVFTPLAIVSTTLLMLTPLSRSWRLGHAAVIIVACMTHFSHLVIVPATAVIALMTQVVLNRKRPLPAGTSVVIGAVALSVFALVASNRWAGRGWELSRGTPLFLLGRVVDAGALPDALARHCPTAHWSLCDAPAPADSRALLWGPDGAVTRAGGWDAFLPEARTITAVLLRDDAVRAALWRSAWRDGAGQLTRLGVGEIAFAWYRKPVSPPYLAVQHDVPHELDDYLASLQNGGARGELQLRAVDRAHTIVLALGLLGLFALLLRGGLPPGERTLLVVLVLGTLFAAMSCAALSLPDQRFLARVSWLIPWGVVAIAAGRR